MKGFAIQLSRMLSIVCISNSSYLIRQDMHLLALAVITAGAFLIDLGWRRK